MQQAQQQPIGIFDSGIGGTSIWKEIVSLLPNEDTVYLADSKNAPYGQKSKQEIIDLSIKNTEFLLEKGCKIIIVACNTATTNAIKHLREKYDIPFIGIEPAIKPAALKTQTNTIGILATKGTLNSELFEKTSSTLDNRITIIEQIGEGLVELIEQGKIGSNEMNQLLTKYIKPMLLANVDCIVLGCTHYPYLADSIKKITNNKITIIDSGEAVARQTKNILLTNNTTNKNVKKASTYSFYTNTNKQILASFLTDYPSANIIEKDF